MADKDVTPGTSILHLPVTRAQARRLVQVLYKAEATKAQAAMDERLLDLLASRMAEQEANHRILRNPEGRADA